MPPNNREGSELWEVLLRTAKSFFAVLLYASVIVFVIKPMSPVVAGLLFFFWGVIYEVDYVRRTIEIDDRDVRRRRVRIHNILGALAQSQKPEPEGISIPISPMYAGPLSSSDSPSSSGEFSEGLRWRNPVKNDTQGPKGSDARSEFK